MISFPTNALILIFWSFYIPSFSLSQSKHEIFSQSSLGNSSNRHLKPLNCPDSPFETNQLEDDDDIEYDSHRFSIYSTGDLGRNFVRIIRGKTKAFYQSVLNDAIMALCDLNSTQVRCVESDSPFAAKDWENKCIIASDLTCPTGMCERTSNCYWKTVYPGEERQTRFPVEEYKSAKLRLTGWRNYSYLRGILTFGGIGIFVAVVLLLLWFLFFIGRYFCCCLWTSCSICFLCSPIPKKKGYRIFFDLLVPIFCYLVCVLGISIASAMAFIGNEDISIASTKTFLHSSGLVEDFSDFLLVARGPLVNINEIVQDAALDAKNIFDGTGYVRTTSSIILDTFVDFGILHGNGLEQSNARSSFDDAFIQFDEQISPIVDEVENMLDTLEVDLYNNVDVIQTSIVSAIAQSDSIYNVTKEYKEKIYEIESQELTTRRIRQTVVLALFIVSLGVAITGFLGILLSKISGKSMFLGLLNLTGFLSALLGCISLVLAAVFLSMNIAWYDICEMSSIVTSDFEPYLGDKVAPGANACFNDTNLAVAFNISDKVDFQAKLDESLLILTKTNISENFASVTTPFGNIQDTIETITTTALEVLNLGTSFNSSTCPFQDIYTKETVLQPWTAHSGKQMSTTWILQSSGEVGSYSREGDETEIEYMTRIYDISGICSTSTSCCLGNVCGIEKGGACNRGNDCLYPCEDLSNLIVKGYAGYLEANEIEIDMTSDLGVICPDSSFCPTESFQELGNNHTLLGLLHDFKTNITSTTDNLVDLASTSVGSTMDEVEVFLCNMNVSFVEKRFDQVKDDLCGSMFGGIAQIHWGLWLLSISLQVLAILANVLCVRLRGLTRKAAKLEREYGGPLSNVEIY